MSAMVCTEKPCALSDEKASSRLGPTAPCAFASASVWQEAQAGDDPFGFEKSSLPWAGSPVVTRPTAPHPAASIATSARRAAGARTRLRLRVWLGDAGQLRDRLVARAVDGEDAVEAGDLEDLRDVAVAADERELAVVRAQALHAADEHAERRGVDEGGRREVDDHLTPALPDHLEQLLLELRCRVQVDLARERDHVRVVGDLLGLDV